MPKRSRTNDPNKIATAVVEEATRERTIDRPEKNPAAVALGRLGGLKGGKARAQRLSSARKKEIAKKAAIARWGKSK